MSMETGGARAAPGGGHARGERSSLSAAAGEARTDRGWRAVESSGSRGYD